MSRPPRTEVLFWAVSGDRSTECHPGPTLPPEAGSR